MGDSSAIHEDGALKSRSSRAKSPAPKTSTKEPKPAGQSSQRPGRSAGPDDGETPLRSPDAEGKTAAAAAEGHLQAEQMQAGASAFLPLAVASVVLGALSVVPYNRLLAADTGCPLFISFVTHIFFVAVNLPRAGTLLLRQQIPFRYHAGCVVLGYLFNALKSSASARLPPALAAVLLNLQMLVGVALQSLAFGKRYTLQQLSGCVAVALGVAVAGAAARVSRHGSQDAAPTPPDQLMLGCVEMLGALSALSLLTSVIKVAFERYGAHADEQILMQHLCGLPLFLLGGQWHLIGPRLQQWVAGGDWWIAFLLLSNLALTFGNRATFVRMSAASPNVLTTQLMETLNKFACLVLTALMNAPPFPPAFFWLGTVVLVAGTAQYLNASAAVAHNLPAKAKAS